MNYEPVIGLEVHAQLLTRSKLFCRCSTQFGKKPNENTCPVCLGLPGVLPVLNRRTVEFAIRAGLAIGARIAEKSLFARKNYFYPDLPKGYQISQYERPICEGGFLEIDTAQGKKRIALTRIHMEEDAGKLLHEHPGTRSKAASWVDLNRAGVPLLEIVSEPEIRSPEEAVSYLKELRRILIYLDICDGNMEEGSLRCDANISLRPVGEKKFGTKVEIKNMNSFRHLEKAVHFEMKRQADALESGRKILQETRLWNPEREETFSMRSKEEAHDYRYFPDPDLLPVEIAQEWVEETRRSLPELPRQRRERLMSEHPLSPSEAALLTESRPLADFFEAIVRGGGPVKKVAAWVINDFLGLAKEDEAILKSPLKPAHVVETFKMLEQGVLSSNMLKTVLQKIFETGQSPAEVVRAEGLVQVSDNTALEAAIDEAMKENPKEVDRYRGGEGKLLSFFLGQVMKKTKGKANPKVLNDLLKTKLR